MPFQAIFAFVGFIVFVGIVSYCVIRSRSLVARIVLALLMVPPALFCLFGFAATFEPMDVATQWTFRIGYAVVGVVLAVTSLLLLIWPLLISRPSSPTAPTEN